MTTTPKDDEARPKPVRVWCDGCYDMVHFGHANSLRQAKSLGDHLVVGVHSDAEIARHKRPPIFTLDERIKMLSAIRWVDEVVRAAPYVTSLAVLQDNDCDFCCHGDDTTVTDRGRDTYQAIKDAGKYREVERTAGISTTDLVDRILRLNSVDRRHHHQHHHHEQKQQQQQQQHEQKKSPWTGASDFLLTTQKIRDFTEERKPPRADDRIVYVSGAFDLFHVGDLELLQRSKELGTYLIVGLHRDDTVKDYMGDNFPIMNVNERFMNIMACKYVDEVVMGAPYTINADLMDHLHVDVVVESNFLSERLGDPYKYPRQVDKLKRVSVDGRMTTEEIVKRILSNRDELEAGNKAKQQKELEMIEGEKR